VSAEDFQRRVGATEKIPKISKKIPQIALFSLFQWELANGIKDQKIAKKGRNIALLSLYLLYLYQV